MNMSNTSQHEVNVDMQPPHSHYNYDDDNDNDNNFNNDNTNHKDSRRGPIRRSATNFVVVRLCGNGINPQ
jgi:hypothetical protein